MTTATKWVLGIGSASLIIFMLTRKSKAETTTEGGGGGAGYGGGGGNGGGNGGGGGNPPPPTDTLPKPVGNTCPPGYSYDSVTRACYVTPSCPMGKTWDRITRTCVKDVIILAGYGDIGVGINDATNTNTGTNTLTLGTSSGLDDGRGKVINNFDGKGRIDLENNFMH